jgi:hypothetical protein
MSVFEKDYGSLSLGKLKARLRFLVLVVVGYICFGNIVLGRIEIIIYYYMR